MFKGGDKLVKKFIKFLKEYQKNCDKYDELLKIRDGTFTEPPIENMLKICNDSIAYPKITNK